MKHLVMHKIFSILENGQETKIGSSCTQFKCSKLITKEIVISSVKFKINKDAFKQAIGGTLASSYTFSYYTSTNPDVATWRYNNNDINLEDYGIEFDSNGNMLDSNYSIVVSCDTTSQIVKGAYCSGQMVVYTEADNEEFDFVDVSCDNLNIVLQASGYYSTNHGLHHEVINYTKGVAQNLVCRMNNPQYQFKYRKLTVFCSYKIDNDMVFDNVKVKIVVAQVEDAKIS